ncbi:MAG: hypothetical protein ACPGXK_06705 [Phycisphaerae bacterium]
MPDFRRPGPLRVGLLLFMWITADSLQVESPYVGDAVFAAEPDTAALPQEPALEEGEKKFLTRLARRTIRDELLGRSMYEPTYVPARLKEVETEALVQLRLSGFLLGAGVGGPSAVMNAVRDAAVTATRSAVGNKLLMPERLADLLVEIELVGDAVPLRIEGDWTQPMVLGPHIQPGEHGMVIFGPKGAHRFSPAEVFTSDVTLPEALRRLAEYTLGNSEAVSNARLMRFRTLHWYQPPRSDEVVTLERGLFPVSLESVTRERLGEAIQQLADYMAYRQLESGLFSYQYEVGLDRYSRQNSLVRQAGALAALSRHAAWSGKSASLGAANLGIRFHLQGLTQIPEQEGGAFIATADGKHKLGVTAMLTQAMLQHPKRGGYIDQIDSLTNGMRWLQRPSGMFMTAFPPAEMMDGQAQFPGEALLALAQYYEVRPSQEVLESFSRAITYYRGFFRDRELPALIPWQAQAFAIMARHTDRADYRDFVFELADWVVDHQIHEGNSPWHVLWGGIAAQQPGHADITTAAFLEALCDATNLARETGDQDRAARYAQAARLATRFVLQLQFKPEEAYFVRSPRDTVNGMRETPTLNLLRISHCQHALVALMKAHDTLFGS